MQPNRILIHYGEIALKGRNRPVFQKRLVNNVVRRLRGAGLDWPVAREHHRVHVAVPDDAGEGDIEKAVAALRDVSGLVWYAPAEFFPSRQHAGVVVFPEPREIAPSVVAQAEAAHQPGAAFAVRVRRADKRFPYRSNELERELGAAILRDTAWERVDLENPDATFHVEVDREGIYLYRDKLPGIGGLPVGAAGRVVALLSGGLDSPVAVYLAAKRGCEVDLVHFTASQLQQANAPDDKVAKLARELSRVTLRSRLHLVPYLHFDAALMGAPSDYGLVLFRRFMMRVAERVATAGGAQALITGDNLGQVASQTLENVATTTQAVSLPVLRPLITYDKQEIVSLARHIGTYDLSIQPYKDCCALVDRHPRTVSRHDAVSRIETETFSDYDRIIEDSLADAVVLEYECGSQVSGEDELTQRRKDAEK